MIHGLGSVRRGLFNGGCVDAQRDVGGGDDDDGDHVERLHGAQRGGRGCGESEEKDGKKNQRAGDIFPQGKKRF